MTPFMVDQAKLNRLGLTLKTLDIDAATEAEWIAINALGNRRKAENEPDDPPQALTDTIKGFRHLPPVVDMQHWFVWQGTSPIASAYASFLHAEQNKHLLDFDLYVLPEWRRQGIATELLKLVVARGQANERTSLLGNSVSAVPAGDAFLSCIGAHMGLSVNENQLVVAELDRTLLQSWITSAAERAGDLELILWVGTFPETELDRIVVMMDAMNSAPRDDLAVEDFHITPEILRQIDASLAARAIERWLMAVRDPATGVYAGFTEIFWRATEPELMRQGDTGVMSAYRNRGLGRWLKAAMLQKVLQERPQVKFIRTGNAASNEAMLKINYELGFKLHKTFKVWQVERSVVEAYLQGDI